MHAILGGCESQPREVFFTLFDHPIASMSIRVLPFASLPHETKTQDYNSSKTQSNQLHKLPVETQESFCLREFHSYTYVLGRVCTSG